MNTSERSIRNPGYTVPLTAPTGARNDMPEPGGYHWRPGQAEREAELAGQLAAIRARAAQIHAEREAQQ